MEQGGLPARNGYSEAHSGQATDTVDLQGEGADHDDHAGAHAGTGEIRRQPV